MNLVDGAVEDFAQIDWQRPWLAALEPTGRRLAALVLQGASVADALNASRLPGVFRFVGQEALPPGVAYEQFIFDTKSVPTRNNLHDFFNGLIWLHYPATKRLFNQWQAAAIAAQGVGAVRGPLRDAITVFDENGALWFAPQPLRDALRRREWRRLGEELRPLWRQSHLVPFGHALLEKLVRPRKSITAHVYLADALPASAHADVDVAVDAWMPAHFQPDSFARKPFNPLPVLGVPGWWSDNENFCFYDDSIVFRCDARKTAQQVAAEPAR
ncbi:hypothetical protein SDC9_60206 [bioreactor metagenome]|uniref:DUF3025 domain-containing protein n=1 Tax=bioreactor metagenome TaxID=1076179 RepID=A0A644XC97_9ZZZZ